MDTQSHSFSYIKGPMARDPKIAPMDKEHLKTESKNLRCEALKNISQQTKLTNDKESILARAQSLPALGRVPFAIRAVLRGHLSKIYAMQWSADSKNIVSASQDGKMIVWSAHKNFKLFLVPLTSAWVMTCAYAPGGDLICCGGLDNACSVYSLRSRDGSARLARVLSGHDAFVACVRFVGDRQILTASGDKTCALWDLETGSQLRCFAGHTADVMSVCLAACDENVFLSGSCDYSAKLWDVRTPHSQLTFPGHADDINDVKFFPSGHAFVSASDDGTCRMFDLASCAQLACYDPQAPHIRSPVTSCDFSPSGRLLFAGDEGYNCHVWDSLRQERVAGIVSGVIAGHSQRVSCLGVAQDGSAICTGSWDGLLKIWN